MSASVPKSDRPRQRVIPEIDREMLKADLRKADSADALKEIGECLDFARRAAGWTLKELAGAVQRDERQVQRWMDGKENTNIAAVFAVERLRQPFVIALARLSDCFDEEPMTLKARKRA